PKLNPLAANQRQQGWSTQRSRSPAYLLPAVLPPLLARRRSTPVLLQFACVISPLPQRAFLAATPSVPFPIPKAPKPALVANRSGFARRRAHQHVQSTDCRG